MHLVVAHRALAREHRGQGRARLRVDVEFRKCFSLQRIDVQRELLQGPLVGVEELLVARAQDEERQRCRFDEVPQLRLAFAQRLLQLFVLRHEALRDHDPRHEQRAREQQHAGEQQRLRGALRFTQGGRDRLGEETHRRVELPDAGHLALARRAVEEAIGVAQLLRDRHQAFDLLVGPRPQVHRLLHRREIPEAPEERDHRVDVGGVVASLEESVARRGVVGIGLGELEARLAIAPGHGDGALVGLEVGVVAVEGVAREVEGRVLLRTRPQAFRAHERASRCEELEAVDRGDEEADDDRDENPDDHHQPSAARNCGEAGKRTRLSAHDDAALLLVLSARRTNTVSNIDYSKQPLFQFWRFRSKNGADAHYSAKCVFFSVKSVVYREN